VYVGSSNFTRGGFLDNVEANVRQQSHALSDADFEALREAFEAALRRQQNDGIR